MEKYFGFDLGDAESAVSELTREKNALPEIVTIRDAESFVTAYAQLPGGEILIGEEACYDTTAVRRSVRFKSRFLTDRDAERHIRSFAAGVLGELYLSARLVKGEDCCFYIGCPAGWSKGDRERYRRIFEEVGYPPARIISESRAALVAACQSRHLQVGYDILSRPVLVVDIGSSTTDFAFIMAGREVELQTSGEVRLGGGLMDEILLEESVKRSADARKLKELFAESEAWRSYCEFAARRLKEKYFQDEDYWRENECKRLIRIPEKGGLRLTITVDEQIADIMLDRGMEKLGGRSFRRAFQDSLAQIRDGLAEHKPELIFLTGGVSRLRHVADWCREAFPDSVVITSAEPEFSVARGLAWSGKVDSEVRAFREEVDQLIQSSAIGQIVLKRTDELYRRTVDALVEPILRRVAVPVFERWRNDEIRRLSDINAVMEREVEAFLHSDEAQELLVQPIRDWLRPVAFDIEEKTIPICVRHNVPFHALSLTSYLSLKDVDLRIDARDVFAVEQFTWMINTIISIIVGLLCGGGGIAIISTGAAGGIVGGVVSLLILMLGKNKMQEILMNADIPKHLRRLIPRSHFESRVGKLTEEVRENFYRDLEENKNAEISEKLARDISEQIGECLAKMAEIVEIPLQ